MAKKGKKTDAMRKSYEKRNMLDYSPVLYKQVEKYGLKILQHRIITPTIINVQQGKNAFSYESPDAANSNE